ARHPAQRRERAGYSLPGGAALARACGVEQLFDNLGSAAFRRPDKALATPRQSGVARIRRSAPPSG
ncbi:hypothetical protein KJJ93_28115, partial [Escherichia coli]|uniref:hypothetical protein n=1 Tax=Escherichia coli TaxID=562 RepID=UPI001BD95301